MSAFLDELNPKARKETMAIYESVYSELVKKHPRLHFLFWKGKDNIRYYNEVLNELNIQHQRPINYPRITDKVLLILILIVMLYNSGPQPDMVVYGFLSVLSFLYPFYFLFVETLAMRNGDRLPFEFRGFYKRLDAFTSMVPSNHNEKLAYQKLKLRMLACLDNQQCTVNIIILLLDVIVNGVMIAVSIFTLVA
ncbi:hypothetical protein CAEBREN_23229 [Caenorhabditis brenneri]|uniref:Uncharacterized protein n=1 Tax=Caenorhabditis brenneri TaxID=135651 RepID=G0MA17_CAEBE|nr:hypothetical protein CAEBREN_23229 [Caenorhabditis brenneri]